MKTIEHGSARGYGWLRGVRTAQCAGAVLAAALWIGAPAMASGAEQEGDRVDVIGHVVAIRGRVHAQSPGEEPRLLQCNDPILRGDRVRTSDDAHLGVLSAEFYTGLDEDTDLEFSATGAGSPDLDLAAGHIRLLDAGGTDEGRIETPGLLAARSGGDTEAFAFPEKAALVSMICPYEDPLRVARLADPNQTTGPAPGQCAVDKPRELLFLVDATHPRLPVLNDQCAPGSLAGLAAARFDVLPDVGLGREDPMPLEPREGTGRMPCDLPGTDCTGSPPATQVINVPPPLPFVP